MVDLKERQARVSRVRSRVASTAVAAVVVVIIAFVLWPEREADGIQVDAPPSAVVGEPFVCQVTLREPIEGLVLNFDLHGKTSTGASLRCVASSPAQKLSASVRGYTFALTLRKPHEDLAHVHAVIYFSSSGRWADHQRVIRSADIPVVSADSAGQSPAMVRLRVHDQVEDSAVIIPDVAWIRMLTAALWAICAAVAWRQWTVRPDSVRIPVLALACLAIALWEATAVGVAVVDLARTLAHDRGLYEDRRWFQQTVTVACVALSGLAAAAALRRSRRDAPAVALAGLALYGVTVLAGMLSLHEIDRVLARSLASLPLATILRIVAAILVLAGLLHRRFVRI